MGSRPKKSKLNTAGLSAEEIFADMNELKNGLSVFDEDLNLIFANKTVRGYFPVLIENLELGLSMKDGIETQIRASNPDMKKDDVENLADKIIYEFQNNGSMKSLEVNGQLINSVYNRMESGRYFSVCTDITRRVKFEKELEQARLDADNANKAKTEFLANMSHEIRTPMSGVFMAAQLLKKELESLNNPALSNLTDILVGSAKHLSATINDVLDISKIEAGEVNISWSDNSLIDMLRDVKTSQEHIAENQGLELRLTIDPSLPETLIHDSMRVRQCVTNLVSNAIKFTESGSVAIGASFDPQTHVVTIQVIDSGAGISHEEQSKVFDHFAQAKQGALTASIGTGLGLPISRKLARLMGGDITLRSELGEGSVFTLTFACKPNISNVQKLAKIA